APDFNLAASAGLNDLAAESRWGLLLAAGPGAFRSKDIVEAGDADRDAVVARVGEIEALGEELFPTVFAIGSGRVSGILRALRVIGIELVVLGVHAGGGGVEEFLDARAVAVL